MKRFQAAYKAHLLKQIQKVSHELRELVSFVSLMIYNYKIIASVFLIINLKNKVLSPSILHLLPIALWAIRSQEGTLRKRGNHWFCSGRHMLWYHCNNNSSLCHSKWSCIKNKSKIELDEGCTNNKLLLLQCMWGMPVVKNNLKVLPCILVLYKQIMTLGN